MFGNQSTNVRNGSYVPEKTQYGREYRISEVRQDVQEDVAAEEYFQVDKLREFHERQTIQKDQLVPIGQDSRQWCIWNSLSLH